MERLRIKYGLARREPTREQAREWRKRTLALIEKGVDPEDAGDRIARRVFDTYDRYAPQPDTLHDILPSVED